MSSLSWPCEGGAAQPRRLPSARRGNVWQRAFATDIAPGYGYVGPVALIGGRDGLVMLYGMDPLGLIVLLVLPVGLFLLVVYLVARILRHVFRRD